MWGALLGSLATNLIPFAAKKLSQIPLANNIYKTISPILSSVMPQVTKIFENQKPQPVMVIQKQTYQSPDQYQQSYNKPKKYGKKLKKQYGRRGGR